MTKLLAKTLLCFFVSTTALGCNLILDNDDPFLLDAASEEPVDATKGPKSPDAGGNHPQPTAPRATRGRPTPTQPTATMPGLPTMPSRRPMPGAPTMPTT